MALIFPVDAPSCPVSFHVFLSSCSVISSLSFFCTHTQSSATSLYTRNLPVTQVSGCPGLYNEVGFHRLSLCTRRAHAHNCPGLSSFRLPKWGACVSMCVPFGTIGILLGWRTCGLFKSCSRGCQGCTLDWRQRRRQCCICEINPGRFEHQRSPRFPLYTLSFPLSFHASSFPFLGAHRSGPYTCTHRLNPSPRSPKMLVPFIAATYIVLSRLPLMSSSVSSARAHLQLSLT